MSLWVLVTVNNEKNKILMSPINLLKMCFSWSVSYVVSCCLNDTFIISELKNSSKTQLNVTVNDCF